MNSAHSPSAAVSASSEGGAFAAVVVWSAAGTPASGEGAVVSSVTRTAGGGAWPRAASVAPQTASSPEELVEGAYR